MSTLANRLGWLTTKHELISDGPVATEQDHRVWAFIHDVVELVQGEPEQQAKEFALLQAAATLRAQGYESAVDMAYKLYNAIHDRESTPPVEHPLVKEVMPGLLAATTGRTQSAHPNIANGPK